MSKKNIYVVLACFFSLAAISQTYTWKNVNLQGMGYVTGIIGHPTGGQVYARTDVYGIYKWDNSNSKWIPLTENKIGKPNIESFAIDPSNANNIYITGGNNQNGSLYKSTDQGLTWNELTDFSTKAINVQGNGSWRGTGERLAVDPNNGGTTLFCGTRSNGLWKSTDYGTTWAQIPSASIPFGAQGGVVFVVFDPSSGNATTNSQKIYVGVQGQGVYYTTDGGASWALFTGGPATTAFPVRAAISNTGIMYVTYSSSQTGSATGFVYKYSGTGTVLANVTPTTKAAEGFWGIGVDPANGNNVSTFQYNIANGNTIHYSTNGGTSWTPKTCAEPTTRSEPGWYPSWAGWTWSAAMLMDPSNYKKTWLTTGFAIYNTPDISVASPLWTARMTNFEELVVGKVICPPVSGGAALLAGFADKQGLRIVDKDVLPSATFEVDAFGITTDLEYCEADPNFIVTVGGDQNNGADWESANQKYRYSTNNGVSWTNFTRPTSTSVNGNIAISCTDKNRWVIAPKDRPGTINEPRYTTNGGASWTVTTGTPIDIANGCTEQWSGSKFLTSDKVNGMKFYYYADYKSGGGAGFYTSTDGGATFVLTNSGLPSSYKSFITSVPGKEGHVFYVNKQGGSLYLTTNGGATFTTLPGITSCTALGIGKAIAPSVEPTLFIAATVGGVNSIFQSTNYGTNWTDISDNNIPTNSVRSITGDMRTAGLLYLSTGGRGVVYGVTNVNSSVPVTGVSVLPTSASLVVGSTQQLSVTIAPSNATNQVVTWSSSNTSIATVNATGLVTAVAAGTATVTVTTVDGAKTATCSLTVSAPAANPTIISSVIGSVQAGSSAVYSYDGNNTTRWANDGITTTNAWIEYSLDNTYNLSSINLLLYNGSSRTYPIEISVNGAVVWSGNTTLTNGVWSKSISAIGNKVRIRMTGANSNGSNWFSIFEANFTGSVSIATVSVTGVSVSPTSASLVVGSTQQLSATIAPTNATNQAVTWSSSNTAVATVSSSGLVTAVAAGTTTVTVKTTDGNKTAASTITVTTPVTSVSVLPTSASLVVGSSQQLSATIAPTNATTQEVTWSSSNTTVATVSSTGLVTAVAAGTTTVTVKTTVGNKTAASTITVTTPVPVTLITSVSKYIKSTNLAVGSLYYTDRTYTVLSLPSSLVDAEFIKTANNDKTLTSANVFSVTFSSSARVYIAYDSRATAVPTWMNNLGFTKVIGQQITTPDVPLNLYSANLTGTIIFGGNKAPGSVGAATNYFVIAVPESSSVLKIKEHINEIITEQTILGVFPNPARDFISISADSEISKITIINSNGKITTINTTNSRNTNVDLSNYYSGIYVIMVRLRNGKVLKQKLIVK